MMNTLLLAAVRMVDNGWLWYLTSLQSRYHLAKVLFELQTETLAGWRETPLLVVASHLGPAKLQLMTSNYYLSGFIFVLIFLLDTLS